MNKDPKDKNERSFSGKTLDLYRNLLRLTNRRLSFVADSMTSAKDINGILSDYENGELFEAISVAIADHKIPRVFEPFTISADISNFNKMIPREDIPEGGSLKFVRNKEYEVLRASLKAVENDFDYSFNVPIINEGDGKIFIGGKYNFSSFNKYNPTVKLKDEEVAVVIDEVMSRLLNRVENTTIIEFSIA